MLRALIPRREMLPGIPGTFSRFEEEMDRMIEDVFGRREPVWMIRETFVPRANLVETENELTVTVDLPGMKPEEVKLELREGALWITGERKEEKEQNGKTFHRTERSYGAFRRIIELPSRVNEEKVEAAFRDGVLNVTLPKAEEVKPKQIEVKS
jgi:HSP20 family protein